MSESIVTLNVGGTLYTTTISTLTRYQDSMLATMFGGTVPLARDKDGNIFIDRDGKTFRYVLNFLRYGQVPLPENREECCLLEVEADFYQINPLIKRLKDRHTNYIYIIYNGDRDPNFPWVIQGKPTALDNLNLPQKYKIQHKSAYSSRMYVSMNMGSDDLFDDNMILREDLRELGWQLQDSRIDSAYRRCQSSLDICIIYRECWYHPQLNPVERVPLNSDSE